ncbi:ADAM family mig-17-like isoform X2 [Biomphalaria pfeifferi]|uniref:ADAM family mig-17-like isoform X2 n=1 Tax=Biomphalaria pfeifferi TaxID=112525 RepID=A0AAD8BFM2_BIOPF|nr:ADAM family mig-17-like isoform X2 [Biomphalaria pfeifferi]
MWSPAVILCFALVVLTKSCQGQTYVLEAYIVVDDSAVQNQVREIATTESYSVKYTKAVANLRKDIDYIVTQVNVLLGSLSQNGVTMEMRIRRLDILSGNIITTFMPGTSYVVDSLVARNSFQNWLNLQNAYANINYDFAMLWTGFNLYGTSGLGDNSITNVAQMCGAAGITVVEFDPTAREAVATARAIGNLLGASNDGALSTSIMAIINAPGDVNRWSYSTCSASSIKDFLKLPKASCLLTTNIASTKPSVTFSSYTGNLFDPDIICQRALNDSRTYMCKSLPQIYKNLLPKGNAVCGQIYCRIPNTMTCTPVYTSDGMVCDNQKRCSVGQCSSYSTPVVDTNCVFGDQKKLEFPTVPFYGTCQAFISLYGALNCYSSPINESCCSTCKTYTSGRVGCEYGDKSFDCVKYTKASICPTYKNTLCCGYCYNYVGKRSPSDEPVQKLNTTLPNIIGQKLDIMSFEEFNSQP